ncbi:hypothetical protein [Nesterenkonia aurantiaca]|uniref:hypothetical protein n=1 Tax=Nesterenkonia aurantiaca TaxID=1436010 RepID=UPI001061A440|nr:hypothetical protein [Nesterenkonia aurantiaca]
MSASRTRHSAMIAVAAAGGLLITACGSEEPTPQPSTSPTHDDIDWAEAYQQSAQQTPEDDWPRGDVQEPVEALFSRHYVEWGDYEEVDDEVSRFFVVMGNFDCHGLQYRVEETQDEVAVAVITGTREGVNECTEEAVLGAIDVELENPVGVRDVVDLSQRL